MAKELEYRQGGLSMAKEVYVTGFLTDITTHTHTLYNKILMVIKRRNSPT